MALTLQLPWEQSRTLWSQELQPSLNCPIILGNAIIDVEFEAGKDKAINHGLNRTPQGWIVTDKNGNANIWRPVAWNASTITLRANVDVKASLWVF